MIFVTYINPEKTSLFLTNFKYEHISKNTIIKLLGNISNKNNNNIRFIKLCYQGYTYTDLRSYIALEPT